MWMQNIFSYKGIHTNGNSGGGGEKKENPDNTMEEVDI